MPDNNRAKLGPLSAVWDKISAAPRESAWIEYKKNRGDPTTIAETLCALSNSAALHDQPAGFLCWGVDDQTRHIVGTTFDYWATKAVGNEDLHTWLSRLLTPRMPITVAEGDIGGGHVVVAEIAAANHTPVRFNSLEYIRVGSHCKKLIDYPELQRQLWDKLRMTDFEAGVAIGNAGSGEIQELLNLPAYFKTTRQASNATELNETLTRFEMEGFVKARDHGRWDITNLGAILFARDMDGFPTIARKKIRVMMYTGVNKASGAAELSHDDGYATCFPQVLETVMSGLPTSEQIVRGVRQSIPAIPEIAVRELLANALIHQDLNFSGTGPMVNVYLDRTEISNPGKPFVDARRLMDLPPRSRNEKLAGFMRRIGYCEERGAGITRVFTALEESHLPAATLNPVLDSFIAKILGPQPLSALSRREKVEACYWHACLRQVSEQRMTNASLRRRLRISDKNYASASRIINETIDEGLIKEYDPTSGNKGKSYVPAWAPTNRIV